MKNILTLIIWFGSVVKEALLGLSFNKMVNGFATVMLGFCIAKSVLGNLKLNDVLLLAVILLFIWKRGLRV